MKGSITLADAKNTVVPPVDPAFDDDQLDFSEALSSYFLNYATYVNMDRAIPDVRDGLKPVQRRLVYTAFDKNIKKRIKSVKVVGDVMGDYHPHGDGSIYGALVNLVQPMKNNVPPFLGQGNWGDFDNPPAAMRYTEMYLNPAAEMLTNDASYVDYIPNFDGRTKEPIVLPSEVPWFWINGTTGIAVAMGTKILPHNLGEIIDATLYLIDHPKCKPEDVCKFVPAPDFPTGGYVAAEDTGDHGKLSAYITGRGSFRLRALIEKETEGKRKAVVIKELPYNVAPGTVMSEIHKMIDEEKIIGVRKLVDETTEKEGMRITIELKPDAIPDIVISLLYKHTSCELGMGMNAMGILDLQPSIFSLKRGLEVWIDFRRTVVIRRFKDEKQKLEHRLHILDGIFKIIGKIKEVIDAVMTSDDPKQMLMTKYKLDEVQAEEVLNITLRRLSRVSRSELEDEKKAKETRLAEVNSILANPGQLDNVIKTELRSHKKKYSRPRRTKVVDSFDRITIADVTADEAAIVILNTDETIKRVKVDEYRSQKRRGKGVTSAAHGAVPKVALSVSAHDDLLFITDRGRAHYSKVYVLPECSRTDCGQDIASLIQLQSNENVSMLLAVDDLKQGTSLFLTTAQGVVMQVEASQFCKNRKAGLQMIRLADDDRVIDVCLVTEDLKEPEIILFTKQGLVSRYPIEKVRVMGRGAAGVAGIRLDKNDEVVSAEIVGSDQKGEILVVTSLGFGKRFSVAEIPTRTNRGGKGVKSGHAKAGDVVGGFFINNKCNIEDGTLFMSTTSGKSIRISLADTRKMGGRAGKGTKLVEIGDRATLATAAVIFEPTTDEE